MKLGKSDVGDVVDGGHIRLGGQDTQVIPPLSSGGLLPKGKRRMVPLRITSRQVCVHSDQIHAQGAADEVSGGVGGANPRFQLSLPVHRHDSQEGVNRVGGGDKVDGPQLREGQLQLMPQLCGPSLLAERTRTLGSPHVNMDECGGGVHTLCPLHHLTRKQAPGVGGLLQLVRAVGEGLKVGMGFGGWVGKATMLQEGHCERNHSCTGGQRHERCST